jgi:hypothetical protein
MRSLAIAVEKSAQVLFRNPNAPPDAVMMKIAARNHSTNGFCRQVQARGDFCDAEHGLLTGGIWHERSDLLADASLTIMGKRPTTRASHAKTIVSRTSAMQWASAGVR